MPERDLGLDALPLRLFPRVFEYRKSGGGVFDANDRCNEGGKSAGDGAWSAPNVEDEVCGSKERQQPRCRVGCRAGAVRAEDRVVVAGGIEGGGHDSGEAAATV